MLPRKGKKGIHYHKNERLEAEDFLLNPRGKKFRSLTLKNGDELRSKLGKTPKSGKKTTKLLPPKAQKSTILH